MTPVRTKLIQAYQASRIEVNENKIRVAVVDDDESFARAIGRLLRAAGFETAVYPSAEAYLQDVAAAPVKCLVLDIQMGGMSGLDLGHRLVEMGAQIPVIYVTALEDGKCHDEARQIGCSTLFHKPVSGRLLVEAIHSAVAPFSKITEP